MQCGDPQAQAYLNLQKLNVSRQHSEEVQVLSRTLDLSNQQNDCSSQGNPAFDSQFSCNLPFYC